MGSDARFAEEVAAAYDLGISHAEFLTWPAVEQDKILAHRQHAARQRRERCPACRTHPDDWRDPITGKPWREPRWEARVVECLGCREVADADGDIPKERRAWSHVQLVPLAPDDDSRTGMHPA